MNNTYIINTEEIFAPRNYDFKELINNYCSDWKNQTTYAHNYYIQLFWCWMVCEWIKVLWNPKITWNYVLKYKFINIPLKFDWKIMDFIQYIIILFLLFHIFQVYYIPIFYL